MEACTRFDCFARTTARRSGDLGRPCSVAPLPSKGRAGEVSHLPRAASPVGFAPSLQGDAMAPSSGNLESVG
jgi:hypothetical protein